MTKEPKRKTKRLHAPEQADTDVIAAANASFKRESDEVIDGWNRRSGSCVAITVLDGPLQWRDRIKEIDRTVDALEEERSSLIQRLADEGLALLRVDGKPMPGEPIKAEDSAQGEDMSDPANWKAGDCVQSISDEADGITEGGIYVLSQDPVDSNLYLIDADGDRRNRMPYRYKWYSRP